VTADVAARMEQVLGSPPRLEPLNGEELGQRELDLIARLRETISHPQDGPVHPFFSTLARQPHFFEGYMQLGISAMAASLAQRERELLILRTGWLCGAPYQFAETTCSPNW
jgi:4-carboxymuconolactone decarboxylase